MRNITKALLKSIMIISVCEGLLDRSWKSVYITLGKICTQFENSTTFLPGYFGNESDMIKLNRSALGDIDQAQSINFPP